MLSKALILLGICLFANAERVHYDGYKVMRMTPKNEDEAKIIQDLDTQGLPFWSGPNPVNRPSDVMFPPHMQGDILEALQNSGIDIKEYVQDVEKLIVEEEKDVQDSLEARIIFNFGAYATLAQAHAYLDEIAANHSSIARTESIGTSFENRDLKLLRITRSGNTKPAIWFDANIHAREWITSAVCLYVVNELLTSTDPQIRRWTEDYDWYILCHHNPDGFEYSRTTDRMWRKTRSTTSSPLGCRGADPNRNFGFHWLGGGSSTNPCTDTYAGPSAFSERETRAASNFQISLGNILSFVLSLHSYSQYILIPYGVNVPFPPHNEYLRIGRLAATAIQQRYNTRFVPGNIVDLLYVASGGSGDWAHGVRGVDLTFTFELRDTGSYGFLLPANQILPSSYEFMDGLRVIIRELGLLLAKKEADKAAADVAE